MEKCKIYKNIIKKDNRGFFCKIFNFKKLHNFRIKEIYISSSKKNCFRGFHFQIPPYAVDKIVTCSKGEALDIVIDLRKKSKNFGKLKYYKLDSINKSLFIPKGFAHGFISLSNNSELIYLTNNVYSKIHDKGVHFSILNLLSKKIKKLKISNRDKKLPKIFEFKNPF